jgi:carboxymethylenebutenolidase
MGTMIELTASDGFTFDAYHVAPTGGRKGGLVLIQEIFGLTAWIKRTSDAYGALGYEVIAPSLYDRQKRGFIAAAVTPETLAEGVKLATDTGLKSPVLDMQACTDKLKASGPVFAVGYCYGGTAAWIAACEVNGIAAASAYYGGMLPNLAHLTPKCPVIAHFGANDPHIPQANINRFKAEKPDVPVYMYDAGHGFARDGSDDYHTPSAKLALERTLALFQANGAIV